MQQNDFDINDVFAKLIQNEIDNIFTTIKEFITKPIKELRLPFKKYIINSYRRIGKTKTLLYKDSFVPLNDIYVDLDIQNNDKICTLQQIVDSIKPGNNYIISATAGAGKSILAKKLFMLIVEKGNIGIPIFFELRNINNTGKGIIDSILSIFESYGLSLTAELLKKMLDKNRFVLILDGYDEIEYSSKNRIDIELKELISKFQNTPVFISTRPDDRLEALIHFNVLHVHPLDKERAIQLIKKLKYEPTVKEKFIKQLNKDLYVKHSDFLSNPLLLTIMLITYSQIAEIPEKMHIFYEQAFDALFFKHDALKTMYKRDIKTKLPIDDFKRVLSIISVNSYLKNQINFSNSSLLDHIRNAKKLTGLTFNNDDYKYDLLNSVCILINDGTLFTYTHRSFQEYFTAHFISFFNITKKKDLLRKLLKKSPRDSVLKLAFEMNTSNIEKNLIIPMGNEYISKYDVAKNDAERLSVCFNGIRASLSSAKSKHAYYVEEDNEFYDFLTYVETIYTKRYKSFAPKYKNTLTRKAFIELFGKGVVNEIIKVDMDNIEKLKKSGVLEIQEKRVSFLKLVIDRISKRDTELDINLDEYL